MKNSLVVCLIFLFIVSGRGIDSYLFAQNKNQDNRNKIITVEKNKSKNKIENKKAKKQEVKKNKSKEKASGLNKKNISNSPNKTIDQKLQDSLKGLWFGDISKNGATPVIEVFERNGKYYAIAFTSRNKKNDDSSLLDTENPDPKMRNRRRGSIVFIEGLSWNARKSCWEGGTYYDADTGKTHNIISVKLAENHKTLTFNLHGKKCEWTYVPNPNRFLDKKVSKI